MAKMVIPSREAWRILQRQRVDDRAQRPGTRIVTRQHHVEDVQTHAAYSARDTVGLSTSAAFQTLPLNTEVNNELGIWTLAANEVTINDTGFFHFTYGFRLYTTGTHITTFHVEEAGVKIVRSEISGLTLATPSNGPTYTNSFIHEITASGQAFRMRGVGSAAGTGFVDLIHLEIHKLT